MAGREKPARDRQKSPGGSSLARFADPRDAELIRS
jgi:hypothetical protein